jgi:hypothetical protein
VEFLSELNRTQQYIHYLVEKAEMEELNGFNRYMSIALQKWNELPLSDEITSRFAEIRPLEVENKKLKHSWWHIVSYGSYMAEEMAKDDLKNQLRQIRGQLASIEFLYKDLH